MMSKPKTPTQLKHNPATSISDDFVVIISFDLEVLSKELELGPTTSYEQQPFCKNAEDENKNSK